MTADDSGRADGGHRPAAGPTESAEPDPTLALGRYLRVVKRRWRTVLLGVAAALAVAAAYLLLVPPSSVAVANVQVNVLSTDPFTATRPAVELVEPTTELVIARSPAVVGPVAEELGVEPAQVRAAMTITMLPDTTALRITYEAEGAERAVRSADLLAQAYLDYRTEVAQARVDELLDQLTDRRDELRAQLADSELTRVRPGAPVTAGQVVLRSELGAVQDQITALELVDVSGGVVLSPARDNPVSVSPAAAPVLLAAVPAGLVLGLLGAVVRHLRDPWLHDEHDVRVAGAGEVLAELRESVVPATAPDQEAIRSLREQVRSRLPGPGAVLVLADLAPEDDGGSLGVNLGIAMAESGVSTEVLFSDRGLPEGADGISQTLAPRAGLEVTLLSTRTDDAAAVAALLEERARPRRPGPARPALTVLECSARDSRANVLRAARLGDAALVVASRRGVAARSLERVAADLAGGGATVLGTVLR